MTNRFIGLLLIIAGLITPMHKDVLSVADKTVMALFLGSGALILLFSFFKKTEEDNIYRYQLHFDGVKLFNESGLPALNIGDRLYIQPYSGPVKEDIHICTAEAQLVAKMPQEHCEHVLYKFEKHSPVHLVVKNIQLDEEYPSYHVDVEMTC